MRSIILTLFLLAASSAHCASWIPGSKVDGSLHRDIPIYLSKTKCQEHFKEKCFPMPQSYNPSYHKLDEEMVDDETKPQWASRSMIESCTSESNCKDMSIAKNKAKPSDCEADDSRLECSVDNCITDRSSYYNKEYSEVWCGKITGYLKKKSGVKIILEDETKKQAYKTQEAARLADEAAMAIASKALSCGKKVISRMLLQNKPKGLKKAQVRNLVKTYKDIKDLLDTGSLESAREDILAVAINEPIVTQADKDALVSELDKCKP